jgi:hypothetical protein
MQKLFAAAVFAAVSFAGVSNANLLTNGTFESGNAGFSSAYVYSPGNIQPEGTFDLVQSPTQSHPQPTVARYGDHTTGTGLMLAVNASPTAGRVVWSQVIPVESGPTYKFDGFVSNWTIGSFPNSTLKLLANDRELLQFSSSRTAAVWEQFTSSFEFSFDGPVTFAIANVNTETVGNDFALDDLSLVVVPEPAMAAVFLLSAGCLIRHPHRRPTACPKEPRTK